PSPSISPLCFAFSLLFSLLSLPPFIPLPLSLSLPLLLSLFLSLSLPLLLSLPSFTATYVYEQTGCMLHSRSSHRVLISCKYLDLQTAGSSCQSQTSADP